MDILPGYWLVPAAGQSEHGASVNLLSLLLQVVVILLATRLVVPLVRRLRQTDVIGEIVAGVLLGPSFLGVIAPDLFASLFDPSTAAVFSALSVLGVVFLMFQLGQEFELKAKLGDTGRTIALVSLLGIAAPFACGYVLAGYLLGTMSDPPANEMAFRFFIGTALSITAIPVLGRIFLELGLSHTRTATVTVSAAAIEDVLAWLLLGGVTLSVAGQLTASWLLGRALGLCAFIALLLVFVRPLLRRFLRAQLLAHGQLRHAAIGLLCGAIFLCAAVTEYLGVHALIGAFLLGVVLHDERRFVSEWKVRVSPLVNTFFLPLFFAYSGLRTDLTSLDELREVGVCLVIIFAAVLGKVGGAYAAARLAGEDRRSSFLIGMCMNTRGLVELVVLNVGYDVGLISRDMFTMFVVMALVTTVITTPVIRYLMKDERAVSAAGVNAALSIALPQDASWDQGERARLGLRQLLDGLLVDRGMADRLGGVLDALLEALRGLVGHKPSSVTLEIADGSGIVRVVVESPAAAALVSKLQAGLRGEREGEDDPAVQVGRRLAHVEKVSECRIAAAVTEQALSIEAELALGPT